MRSASQCATDKERVAGREAQGGEVPSVGGTQLCAPRPLAPVEGLPLTALKTGLASKNGPGFSLPLEDVTITLHSELPLGVVTFSGALSCFRTE